MDTVYSQLQGQPRTSTGNFWHKLIYPNQIWLDGLYMAQPFHRRLGSSPGMAGVTNVQQITR